MGWGRRGGRKEEKEEEEEEIGEGAFQENFPLAGSHDLSFGLQQELIFLAPLKIRLPSQVSFTGRFWVHFLRKRTAFRNVFIKVCQLIDHADAAH